MRHSSKLLTIPARDPAPAFDDLTFTIEQAPHVPDGVYDVVCERVRKTTKFGREVLRFDFRIVSQGAGFDVHVPTYINMPTHGRGRQARARSKLAAWFSVVQTFDPSWNRLHVSLFTQYQFQARLTTVTKDRLQKPIPARQQYSKVEELIEVIGRLA